MIEEAENSGRNHPIELLSRKPKELEHAEDDDPINISNLELSDHSVQISNDSLLTDNEFAHIKSPPPNH